MRINLQSLRFIAEHRVAKIIFVGVLFGAFAIGYYHTFANPRKLSDDWEQFSFMKGKPLGLLYEWMASDRARPMHESQLFATLKGNEMSLYYAQEIDPFGGYSRCGGFPCGLQAGPKLGALTFVKSGSQWRVSKTTGKTSFLRGATCRLVKYNDWGGMQLVCRKASGPYEVGSDRQIEIDSVYHFIDPAV